VLQRRPGAGRSPGWGREQGMGLRSVRPAGRRVFAAACDCGSARGVFELALHYASERKQFGRSIGTFQSIAHMLADMQTEIEAAWALTLRAASLVAAGKDALREITMAKLFASETYVKAANTGMQIFGGFGYSMEFDMQRHYRGA